MKLKLTQQIIIGQKHKNYASLDRLCWLSKNLYNQALYQIRQQYSKDKTYLGYSKLYRLLYDTKQPDYFALPYAQCSQQILRLVDKTYTSFFKGIKSAKNKGKKVRLPKYKDKENGRYVFVYTSQCIKVKDGILRLKVNKTDFIYLNCDKEDVCQVRIVPKGNHIVVEVIYQVEYELKKDNGNYASIDLGIDNIVALASNSAQSVLYNGRPLKAINHFYNKRKAELQSKVKTKSTKRIKRLNGKRNRKVKDFMHKLSHAIVCYMESNNINTLIVGKNVGWKDSIRLGHVVNQNFVSIPYNMLIQMLEYKCKLKGITFIVVNEAYTSKCSFMDNEKICKHKVYAGSRIRRGLFVTKNGLKLNADINGALNIMVLGCTKINVKRDALVIEPANMMFAVNPIRLTLSQ